MKEVTGTKESERISKRNMLNMLQSGGLEKGGEKNMESGEIEKSIECESEDTRAKSPATSEEGERDEQRVQRQVKRVSKESRDK